MTTLIDQDPIFGPLLQRSEVFRQELTAAIAAAALSNKESQCQYQSRISTLEVEIERLRKASATADSDVHTPGPSHTIDGVEYVTKDEYNKILKSLQHTGKKYHAVKHRLEGFTSDDAEPGKETPQGQQQLRREFEMERAKVKEFERKFGTLTQLLDVTQSAIKALMKTDTDAMKQYKKYLEEDDRWKAEILEKGTITAADFDRRPSRDPWPNIAGPLKHLSKSITSNNIMRTRGQSMPPPPRTGSTTSTSTPCPPTKLPLQPIKAAPPSPIDAPTQDPDATSDEEEQYDHDDDGDEPESVLQKFSPTSRAIMRKPGSETLAVLHPEPFSPTQSKVTDVDWEVTEDAFANIKSEPMSEPDWYSKYGYSRLVDGEQETFDLDNVTVPRPTSTGIRSFGQMITSPEKEGIRSPFLTQSSSFSQQTRSSGTARERQSAIPGSKVVQNEPIVVSDTTEKGFATFQPPEQTGKEKGTPTSIANLEASPANPQPSSKPEPLQEPAARVEAPVATAPRNPLGEIPDPNGLLEPGSTSIDNLQPASRKNQPDVLFANKESNDKENPPTRKNLTNLLSTPTQNNRLPPSTAARSTGALKLKRRSLGSMSATKIPVKRSSLVFHPHDQATGLAEITHTATPNFATPGEKRAPEGLQGGSSHKKKQRIEEPTTPTEATAKKPDNPFSPSKYRINKAKNDGLDFAFGEVVRDKARKDCLPKCVKECCRDLASGKLHEMWEPPAPYTSAKFGARDSSPPAPDEDGGEAKRNQQYNDWNIAREKSERNLQFGRHRAQHQKAQEVMGYWESDFPTTQQLEEQRKESEKRYMEKGFDRYEQATKGGMYERRT
ncbi:hypothetical protein TWF481_011131 [Arthrobotrys musiformis]|uniref:DNA endonuclease activator Ctp1 C-terminal domain-containing protein n=1 Tax=Arthrobotrys musiformis TaxID=47236 RepID=A0AAV9VZJ0_9PEZI